MGSTAYELKSQEASARPGSLKLQVVSSQEQISQHFSVQMDQEVCGKEVVVSKVDRGPNEELRNVLIWLEGPALRQLPPPDFGDASLEIKNCRFQSEFVFMGKGSTLKIKSLDPINYDLQFTKADGKDSFRSLPPNLDGVNIEFKDPGIVISSCSLHPWMAAHIIIPSHSYFALTNIHGEVQFNKLPVGRYKIHFWHSGLGKKELAEPVFVSGTPLTRKFRWEDL